MNKLCHEKVKHEFPPVFHWVCFKDFYTYSQDSYKTWWKHCNQSFL